MRLANGELALDLPAGVDRVEAIAWNASFEAENGMVVSPEGWISFTGVLLEKIGQYRPDLRNGFAAHDLEAVCEDLLQLRAELLMAS